MIGIVLACSLAVLLISNFGAESAFADGPRLAVDAVTEGNTASELGPLDPCVSVSKGDVFDVDIVVYDLVDLLAWEIYFEYDPAVVEIKKRNVRLFQAGNTGSSVYDVSETLPDNDGLYRLAAADIADPPSPDSGSGALARLTLRAIAPGTSPARLASRDVTGDGVPDIGPFLRDVEGVPIGDQTDDSFFDGPVEHASIVVDGRCPGVGGGAGAARPAEGGGINLLYVMAAVAAGVVTVTAVAALLLSRRREAGPDEAA